MPAGPDISGALQVMTACLRPGAMSLRWRCDYRESVNMLLFSVKAIRVFMAGEVCFIDCGV
jgi:hypothetical protein